ncbi:hypothetical protein ACU8KH_00421 [Lachancea thermotolerans]
MIWNSTTYNHTKNPKKTRRRSTTTPRGQNWPSSTRYSDYWRHLYSYAIATALSSPRQVSHISKFYIKHNSWVKNQDFDLVVESMGRYSLLKFIKKLTSFILEKLAKKFGILSTNYSDLQQ